MARDSNVDAAALADNVCRLIDAVDHLRAETARDHTDTAVAINTIEDLERRIGVVEVELAELRKGQHRARGAQWALGVVATVIALATAVAELVMHAIP